MLLLGSYINLSWLMINNNYKFNIIDKLRSEVLLNIIIKDRLHRIGCIAISLSINQYKSFYLARMSIKLFKRIKYETESIVQNHLN